MAPFIYFRVPSYGLFAFIGLLVALSYIYYQFVAENPLSINATELTWLVIACGVGCLIGSKVLFCISQLPRLLTDFSISALTNSLLFGGLVFYGGLLGALLGAALFAKRHKRSAKTTFNAITPALVLFHAFGRIGCFMAGCCYGFRLSSAWTVQGITFHYFPIQLVEAVFEFILFFVLTKAVKLENRCCVYLFVYALYRFVAEFFRGDEVRGRFLGITTSQWISVFIVGALITIAVRKYRYKCPIYSE